MHWAYFIFYFFSFKNMILIYKRQSGYIFVNIYSLNWKRLASAHIVQPCKLKNRFLVHKCNESLMSRDLLQTMKTHFKPLKKFPALIKCISSGDKKIHKEGKEEDHSLQHSSGDWTKLKRFKKKNGTSLLPLSSIHYSNYFTKGRKTSF